MAGEDPTAKSFAEALPYTRPPRHMPQLSHLVARSPRPHLVLMEVASRVVLQSQSATSVEVLNTCGGTVPSGAHQKRPLVTQGLRGLTLLPVQQ